MGLQLEGFWAVATLVCPQLQVLEVALPICFLQVSGPSDNLHIKRQGCQGMLLFPALTKDTLSTASGSLGGETESGLLPKLKSVTECWVVNCTEQSDNVYKKKMHGSNCDV